MDGIGNALSVARSLGREGVRVYALNYPDSYVASSRYCKLIRTPAGANPEEGWAGYLLGPESDELAGAVLLALGDTGIQVITQNREELAQKFLLDVVNPDAQACMLNKLATYQQAVAAGVPTPRFWVIETRRQVLSLEKELVYPLLVKPFFSHLYQKAFGKKFVEVKTFDELLRALDAVEGSGLQVMLVEKIPGPDDRLCSYYTYLDEAGEPLFHFTKRIIRRFPVNRGGACYHITDWNPEVRDLGLQLFRQVGLRGLANVEFKRDDRDGQLKLIEVNARFTAATCLLTASGFDLGLFVYNRLTGRPQRSLENYRKGMRLWYPREDYHAFRELNKRGEITLWQWLASIARPQVLPYFSWRDPGPTLAQESRRLRASLARRLKALGRLLLGR